MAAEAPAVPATEDDLEALFDAAVAETREEKKAPAAPAPAPVVSQPRVRTRVAPRKRVKAEATSPGSPPPDKTAAYLVKEAAKLRGTGVEEAMKGLAELFGGGGASRASLPTLGRRARRRPRRPYRACACGSRAKGPIGRPAKGLTVAWERGGQAV
jgi:hypothetical protein